MAPLHPTHSIPEETPMPVTALWTASPSNTADVEHGMQAMIAALLNNGSTKQAAQPAKHWSTGLCVGDCVEHVLRVGR